MKYLILSLFIFFNFAFAFDSIEVLNPNITLHKSGYFRTDRSLTPDQALKEHFKPLPEKAISFGFDHHTYWFLFEISAATDEQLFIDSKCIVSEYQTLYVYNGNQLIREEKNGYFTPIHERAIQTFPIRFKLDNNNKRIYLLKISSKSPLYSSFSLGNTYDINHEWNWLFTLMIIAVSTSFAFTIYNAFLFFITKDKAYLYYCMYIMGFLGLNFIGLGYLPLIQSIDTQHAYHYFLISVLIKIVGLVFFATYFLQLKERHPQWYTIFLVLLAINISLGVLYAFRIAQPIFALSVQITILFSILVGIKSYLSHFKPAVFYLAATGIGNVFFLGFMLMNQSHGIQYSILTLNLSNIALVWDLIIFSFALAYRIKLLQEENSKNERLALMQSRQKVIGELTGNIAHQWRLPLNTLGAIISKVEAKLRYDSISKDELLDSCSTSASVLKHLSGTIDTLQDFFVYKSLEKEQFDLNEQVHAITHFLQDTMNDKKIDVLFNPKQTIVICSDRNLLSQVMMNILLNAKNILIEHNENSKKFIIIETREQNHIAIIKIKDNGGGIQIKPIEKIFEPFVSNKHHGSGIGLYMSKNIIEKLGGTLSASNTSYGAEFTITLPI